MPTQVVHSAGGAAAFTYDGEGRRVKKAVSGGSTTYYISEDYEVIDALAVTYVFAGTLRIAKISTDGTLYFHKDHLGSSTVMSDGTGIGSVETTEYLPFGSMRAHTGSTLTAYKFTDQELDAETGLYNYDARLYDPVIGRFISPDTVIPDPYNPQSLNRYSYCLNNPLIYVDPSGRVLITAGVCLIGAKALAALVAWGGWEAASHLIGNPEVAPGTHVDDIGIMMIGGKAVAETTVITTGIVGVELGMFAYGYGLTNPGFTTNAYDFGESLLTEGPPTNQSWGGYFGTGLRSVAKATYNAFDSFTSPTDNISSFCDSGTAASSSYSVSSYGVGSTQSNTSYSVAGMMGISTSFSVDSTLAPSGNDSNDNNAGVW